MLELLLHGTISGEERIETRHTGGTAPYGLLKIGDQNCSKFVTPYESRAERPGERFANCVVKMTGGASGRLVPGMTVGLEIS